MNTIPPLCFHFVQRTNTKIRFTNLQLTKLNKCLLQELPRLFTVPLHKHTIHSWARQKTHSNRVHINTVERTEYQNPEVNRKSTAHNTETHPHIFKNEKILKPQEKDSSTFTQRNAALEETRLTGSTKSKN